MALFLRNCWYVAAESTEVENRIFARQILDDHLILFRRTDGTVVALSDRCPHRYLPLSKGRIVGDNIQCGYHGLVFNGAGACVEIPTQDTIPHTARVRSYPVAERYGFIWVWTGDVSRCDEALIPEFQTTHNYDLGLRLNADFESYYGYKKVHGNYQLMVDNLLDLSHIGFVHDTTIGSEESTRQHASGRQEIKGKTVSDYRLAVNVETPMAFTKMVPPDIRKVDFWLDMHHHTPSAFLHLFGVTPAGLARDEGAGFQGFHLLTPETGATTHYYYGASFLVKGGPRAVIDMLEEAGEIAFNQDLVVIEAQQRTLGELDPVRDGKVTLEADRAGIMARRLLDKELNREQVN